MIQPTIILELIFYVALTLYAIFIAYKALYAYHTTKKKIAALVAIAFILIALHHTTQILKIADETLFLFFALLTILFSFYRKIIYLKTSQKKIFQLHVPQIILGICTISGILFFITTLLHYLIGIAFIQIRIISHIIIRIGILILGYFLYNLSKNDVYKYLLQSFIIICFAPLLFLPISLLLTLFAATINQHFLLILSEIPVIILSIYAYHLSLKTINIIQGQQEEIY
jgi:hypothetical protein